MDNIEHNIKKPLRKHIASFTSCLVTSSTYFNVCFRVKTVSIRLQVFPANMKKGPPTQRQQIEKVPLSQKNPECRFLSQKYSEFRALYDAVVVVVFIPLKWQMPTRTKEIDKRTGRSLLHLSCTAVNTNDDGCGSVLCSNNIRIVQPIACLVVLRVVVVVVVMAVDSLTMMTYFATSRETAK
uniref:Uncharacterized protein n=1 Tax=Glossina pallidipes TaxID=7398 RepID=A0A1A9ZDY0_GLOPL